MAADDADAARGVEFTPDMREQLYSEGSTHRILISERMLEQLVEFGKTTRSVPESSPIGPGLCVIDVVSRDDLEALDQDQDQEETA